jgi:hypothetical protein
MPQVWQAPSFAFAYPGRIAIVFADFWSSGVPRTIGFYGFVAAVTGWASLLFGYFVDGNFHSLARTINFFSYFSTLSNILAALTLTVAAFQPAERRHWLTRPLAATGIALYMGITGLPFIIQLLWSPFGLLVAVDFRLHYLMPTVYLLFWLIYVPQGTLLPRDIRIWLIFPFVYAIYALIRGAYSGFYPLPFLNVDALGFIRVFANMGLMLISLLVLSGILLLIDYGVGRWRIAPDTVH